MGFISKVELKRQLMAMGIKVEGNYVKKSSIDNNQKIKNLCESNRAGSLFDTFDELEGVMGSVDSLSDKLGKVEASLKEALPHLDDNARAAAKKCILYIVELDKNIARFVAGIDKDSKFPVDDPFA